jgi:hypothetical protein
METEVKTKYTYTGQLRWIVPQTRFQVDDQYEFNMMFSSRSSRA